MSGDVGKPNRFGHCSTGMGSSAFDIDIAKNDRPPKSTPSNLVATEDAAAPLPAELSLAMTSIKRSLDWSCST
jgi:hypothetical protein